MLNHHLYYINFYISIFTFFKKTFFFFLLRQISIFNKENLVHAIYKVLRVFSLYILDIAETNSHALPLYIFTLQYTKSINPNYEKSGIYWKIQHEIVSLIFWPSQLKQKSISTQAALNEKIKFSLKRKIVSNIFTLYQRLQHHKFIESWGFGFIYG